MKKKLISSVVLLTCVLQFLSLPSLSYNSEGEMPGVFHFAICSDKEFISIIDGATENDDYVNSAAIENPRVSTTMTM